MDEHSEVKEEQIEMDYRSPFEKWAIDYDLDIENEDCEILYQD